MRVVAVISPKGGVGKTTVTANLAAALSQLGERITVLDLDPQNALRLHFGMPYEETSGIARPEAASGGWRPFLHVSRFGVDFIPYGIVNAKEREQFEHGVQFQQNWLFQHLNSLGLQENSVVLIDTPPGPSIYLQQVLQVAHVGLVVLKPDAASYSTVPSIEALLEFYTGKRKDFLGHCFVLNQMDASKQLCRDVYGMLRAQLGGRFVPAAIHRDEGVREALACQMPVAEYARFCSATQDVQHLAQWLQTHFGLID